MASIEQINKNVNDVAEAIKAFNEQKLFRNQSRQLRAEAAAAFPVLRDCPLPPTDAYEPFVIMNKMVEADRRKFGAEIFQRTINYLRLLAAKSLYPRGTLLEQVIVNVVDGKLQGIQLVPKYLSTEPQPLEQIKQFRDWTYQETVALPASGHAVDFYFQANGNTFYTNLTLVQMAKIVTSVNQINLVEDPGKVFVSDGRVLSNQVIFEEKHKAFVQEGSQELWVMLARFCNDHTAITSLHLIPDWLHAYVKYENPTPLGDVFTNQCNSPNALERLRIILGMYPTKIPYFGLEKFNDAFKQIINGPTFPAWYQSKLYQMYFLSNSFVVGDKPIGAGVALTCPANAEKLKELSAQYE